MTNSSESRPRFDLENLHIVDLIRNVVISSYSETDQPDQSSTSTDDEKEKVNDKPELIPCVTSIWRQESN